MAAALLAGCVRPLKLSNAPALPGEPPLHAILAIMMHHWDGPPAILADSTAVPPPLTPGAFIKGYWVDTARAGFAAALHDLVVHAAERQVIDSASVAGLPLQLVHRRPPAQEFVGPSAGHWFMRVSRIGFNGDSTFAAIYDTYYCGMLCAGASVSLYARRPGRRWTLWSTELLWIS
jgi:hypothetical protein